MPGWLVDEIESMSQHGSAVMQTGKCHIGTCDPNIQKILGGHGFLDHQSHRYAVAMYIDDSEFLAKKMLALIRQFRKHGKGLFAIINA